MSQLYANENVNVMKLKIYQHGISGAKACKYGLSESQALAHIGCQRKSGINSVTAQPLCWRRSVAQCGAAAAKLSMA